MQKTDKILICTLALGISFLVGFMVSVMARPISSEKQTIGDSTLSVHPDIYADNPEQLQSGYTLNTLQDTHIPRVSNVKLEVR